MSEVLIDITYHHYGKDYHVKVFRPYPYGQGSFQIIINGYFHGSVNHYSTGWGVYLNSDILYSDDIGAILDAVEDQPY